MARIFVCVAAVSVIALCGPVYADENNSLSTRVSVQGVNFDNPDDARAFHERLLKAAHKVCDVASASLEAQEENAACRTHAMDEVVVSLDKAQLSHMHAEFVSGERQEVAAQANNDW